MKTITSISQFAVVVLAGFLLAAAPATKPAPIGPRHAVHRVTGLFAPDREADLRAVLEKIPGVELISFDFDHAEATISYDPTKAFAGTKPDKIIERFDQLLRDASHHTMGIKAVCTTPRDKLQRIEIPVAGLDCKACSLAAYEIMAKQDGVEQATASFKEGRLTALIDPAKIDRAKLEAILKDRGVTLVKP